MAQQTQGKKQQNNNTRTIVTILLLIFFPLIGIVVMWFWPKWEKGIKILMTIIVAIWGLILLIPFAALVATITPFEQIEKAKCVTECMRNEGKTESMCRQQCISEEPLQIDQKAPNINIPLEDDTEVLPVN